MLRTEDGQHVLWVHNVPGGDLSELSPAEQIGACGEDTERNAEANIRLLEAAPELLEAAELLISQYNRDPATMRITQLRALVKRIRGA
jgi:hypothetical protein